MRPSGERGFSLVELMIVIALIGIMAGIVAPNVLGSIPGMRVNGAAREVLADFRLARTLAVSRGRNAIVDFTVPAAGQFRVYVDANANGTCDAGEEIKAVTLPTEFPGTALRTNDTTVPVGAADGVDFAGVNAVTFQPNGAASAAGNVYLMPARDAGTRNDRNRRVTVIASTGNVSIQSFNGTSWQ